jgi:3-oxoadipate enol-lactonase/4-carboxymuconolactone decarboxylase
VKSLPTTREDTMICDTGSAVLHYEVIDQVPPWRRPAATLVFCHGVATDSHVWGDWLPVLAGDFRLVRFDTRGFGRSTSRQLPAEWTVDSFADDIVAVAAAAGAQHFHLVGESFGGTASLALAARANSPVLTLACVSTAHRGFTLEPVRRWREELHAHGIRAWSDQMMDRRFPPGVLTPSQWNWFAGTQAQCDPEALLCVGELLVRTDLTAELERIQAPTLLLTPDASPFVTVDLSCQIRQRVPRCELAVFPNARHGLPFSHATACAMAVRDFIHRQCL